MLVVTPLIEGFKKAFPESIVSIGVGDWAKPLLEYNPHVDEIIPCNAPWHNKQNCRFPANSPKTFLEGLLYIMFSKEVRNIIKNKYTHGIDVLGSRQGSWLMRRAKIPNRFGVKGYAGGDNWCTKYIDFKEERKVAEAGLEFLKLIGSEEKIEPRPQIYLTKKEEKAAEQKWKSYCELNHRIIIAPGGGFPEKCWGDANYTELTKKLVNDLDCHIIIIGSKEDSNRINIEPNLKITNLCGKITIRESAALVSKAKLVITNSSLSMHLAGAFKIPSITLLGEWYDSKKLHYRQWGYPEGYVFGKEIKNQVFKVTQIKETYNTVIDIL